MWPDAASRSSGSSRRTSSPRRGGSGGAGAGASVGKRGSVLAGGMQRRPSRSPSPRRTVHFAPGTRVEQRRDTSDGVDEGDGGE
jgi:hypothetical protein